jgi:hypothetical protein
MSDLVMSLDRMSKEVTAMQREMLRSGQPVANLIVHAYAFAGRTEAESNTRGVAMMKEAQQIEASLGDVRQRLKEMKGIARVAVDAIDENEARRKTAAAKLGN